MKDPHPVPPRTIPERDFADVDDARRVFVSRIERAKDAYAFDAATAEKAGLPDLGNTRPNVVAVEASKVFRRACLWAFYEYVHATTVYASSDDKERARQALDDLGERINVLDARREAEAEQRYGLERGELAGFHA